MLALFFAAPQNVVAVHALCVFRSNEVQKRRTTFLLVFGTKDLDTDQETPSNVQFFVFLLQIVKMMSPRFQPSQCRRRVLCTVNTIEKDRTTVRSSTKPLAKHCYSQRSDRAFVLLTRHANPVLSQSKAQLSAAARSEND